MSTQGEINTRSDDEIDVSIIVPVLNESESLPQLAAEISAVAATLPHLRFECIVIDDGSTDGTWKLLETLLIPGTTLRAIRFRRNFGKAAALAIGSDAAHGAILVTIDGDLQDDPAEIVRLLEALEGGLDLVSGWKRDRKDPFIRRITSHVFNNLSNRIIGVELNDSNCGLKAARTPVYRRLPLYGELHRFIPMMASDQGYRVGEIVVTHRPRQHGRSRYGGERYVRALLDLLTVLVLTRYGRRPGHFFGGLGLMLGLVGSAALAYLSGVWIFTDNPIGQRPLLAFGVLLELAALQLLSVGILAELLLHRTSPRPGGDLVVERLDPT